MPLVSVQSRSLKDRRLFYKPRPSASSGDVWNLEVIFYFSLSAFCRPVGTPFEDGKFSILIYLVHKVQARWEHVHPRSGFD